MDFAYHIHTEVGHRCRGARVDGKIVPLNTALENGQKIEILTGKEIAPNRDWLRKSLGYLGSTRSRAKVRSWFKKQARDENMLRGRALIEREFRRMSLTSIDYRRLAEHLNFPAVEDMMAALGAGDLSTSRLVSIAETLFSNAPELQTQLFSPSREDSSAQQDEFKVQGVGNLLTTLAQCCKPLRGDEIIGYVTQNRGVTIHRKDCTDFLQSAELQPDRVIEVSWGREESGRYPVEIALEAYDRTGLLGDITGLLSLMRVNVTHVNTHSDRANSIAHMRLTIEISDIEQLVRILGRLNNMPNVISAIRVKN